MKYYLIITLAVLLIFSCNNKKNNQKKINNDSYDTEVKDTIKHMNTEIYLTVITDCEPLTKYCIEFSDNRGDPVSIQGLQQYFTSKVNPGKKVIWMSAADSDPKINIIEVNFKSGDSILEKKHMNAKDSVVVGKVKKNGKNKSNEFYNITFSIGNDTIVIDPIIQLHH